MFRCRRLIIALIVGALMELPLWGASTVTAKGSDQPDGAAAGLYMLEQQNGRTLLQLDGVSLDTMPTGAVTLGPVSLRPMLAPPTIVASPHGSMFAVITDSCLGCYPPEPLKYITIRVISRSGVVLHRFHPGTHLTITAISDDGSRISGWYFASSATSPEHWYTLDGATGKVLRSVPVPTAGQLLYDAAHDRLYTSDVTTDHHLRLTAYDLTSGTRASQVVLSDVTAGNWNTNQQARDGLPIIHFADPAVALSPDGRQIAVYDGAASRLVTVDAPAMTIARTQQVTHPTGSSGLLGLLTDALGLAPGVAEAKGMAEGMQLEMQFGSDDRSLYVTGATYGPDDRGYPSSQSIGLERIDLATGQLAASTLDGASIRWLAEGADGTALYVLVPQDHGWCPCTLSRLDPQTLQATAQRTLPSDWALQLYVLG